MWVGRPRGARRRVSRVRAMAPAWGPKVVAETACGAVLALEAIGSLLMWAPIPFAWMWVGGHVYTATGSLFADRHVVLGGLIAPIVVVMSGRQRLDRLWVRLRHRAGHDQAEDALTQVAVVS